jgi:hypothetical protein
MTAACKSARRQEILGMEKFAEAIRWPLISFTLHSVALSFKFGNPFAFDFDFG